MNKNMFSIPAEFLIVNLASILPSILYLSTLAESQYNPSSPGAEASDRPTDRLTDWQLAW